MGVTHILYRVGDNVTTWKRIQHSIMPHGDAIINGYRVKFGRIAPQSLNLLFYNLSGLMQVGVSRYKLCE